MAYKKRELPLLSFVTPNYNDGKTIEAMVDSIMEQDYPNIEQIIVDDGSTDNSKEILEKLEKKYDKVKVLYLEKNEGACIARNLGASHATGKYISFLPADAKLYPGVARIWVDFLERNPEYDFLYGGYKFVDENGHEVFSYMSDDFDPYFLQVTNYIDGSFPLKKELFDKMGGWDASIKSLQDWDFWLTAVLEHGAKGLYKKEVYFETTLPHPGGLSDDSNRNWVARLDQIKHKHNIPFRNICVTGQGAPFHAKNVAKILGADYLDMPSFKPHKYEMIYIIGFFGNVDQALQNTRALRVVHWIGSDILVLRQAKEDVKQATLEWIDNNIDVHFCEMEATQKELAELGIRARVLPFPPRIISQPEPLPEKFSIAVYDPYQNKQFYYPDFIKGVIKKTPDIQWELFGDPTLFGSKDNIRHNGVTNEEETRQLIKDTSMILRLTPHDGLPLSVVEWIMAGRNAITTVDLKYADNFKLEQFKGEGEATQEEIDAVVAENEERLIKLIREVQKKGINEEGSKYYNDVCDKEKFVNTINGLLNFDMKTWWDEMSPFWEGMENGQISVEDMITAVREIRSLKPKNIIDIGCGTGRWVDMLPEVTYTGVDFSQKLIDKAKEKHPDKEFICDSIEDFTNKVNEKYDLAFSFASLLHIRPEDMESVAEKLKKIAHRAVFIEPIKEAPSNGGNRLVNQDIIKKQKESDWFFNVKYTWCHDYFKYFDVVKAIPVSNNRMLFVINLDEKKQSLGKVLTEGEIL